MDVQASTWIIWLGGHFGSLDRILITEPVMELAIC